MSYYLEDKTLDKNHNTDWQNNSKSYKKQIINNDW